LKEKVEDIYNICCEPAATSDLDGDPVFMLTMIEHKLESLLQEVEPLNPEFIGKLERLRDKERRKQNRELKNLRMQERLVESRRTKPLENNQLSPTKRQGKPLMIRSKPVDDKKKANESMNTLDRDNEQRDDFYEMFHS
jgi:hypothetical protein